MKKFYEDVDVEIISFSAEDVITTSGEDEAVGPGINVGTEEDAGDDSWGA